MGDDLRQKCRPFWCIYSTTKQLCYDRRYLVLQSELNLTLEEFMGLWEQQPYIEKYNYCVQHLDNPTDQLLVLFSDRKVDLAATEGYFTRMKEAGVHRAILVTFNGIASVAMTMLEKLKATNFHIQVFDKSELMVNITKHVLVPKHQVLTEAEKEALLKRYRLPETSLPCIQEEDPVARYYGLQRGQVVRITRRSETAGRYVTYRIVIGGLV